MKTFTIDNDNNITAFPTPDHAEAAVGTPPSAWKRLRGVPCGLAATTARAWTRSSRTSSTGYLGAELQAITDWDALKL